MPSSKELVRSLFQFKDLSRVPFIPWVGSFAAQLEQIDVEEMLNDPGALSRALLNAQRLFGYDVIATPIDPSLEAEACGCSIEWGGPGDLPAVTGHPMADGHELDIANFEKQGRVPVVIDAIKRINAVRGKEVAIAGVVTGPLALAHLLRGDALLNDPPDDAARTIALAGSVSLKLARLYCEAGTDVIVIIGPSLGPVPLATLRLAAAPLKSIWNVVHFYGAHSLLVVHGVRTDHLPALLDFGADGVAISGEIDQAELAQTVLARRSCYGRPLPVSALLDSGPPAAGLPVAPAKGLFLTTDWDIPYEASVERMNALMRAIGH